MIEQFRRASESWVAKGLFLFMAVAFIIMWGGGDIVHQIGTHSQTVATVGKRKITSREFADAFNHKVREIQLRTGQLLDEEKAWKIGLPEMVRERLVQESLLDLEAERLNVYVSDHFVRDHIRQDKVFQDNGKFSHERFKMLIAKINYDEKTYIEFLRRELVRERLIDALTSGINIPKAMVVPLCLWKNEQRQINTLTIDSQKITINEKPSEQVLHSFFDAHIDEFKAPEYRNFAVLTFSTDDVRKNIIVTSDDIDNEYQLQKKDFPDKKLADIKNQLVDDIKNQRLGHEVQNLITGIEDAIGAGNSLAEIAAKHNLTIKNFNSVDRNGLYDPFNNELEVKEPKIDLPEKIFASVLKDAFTIDLNTIGSIIEAGQGQYFITEVTAMSSASARTFDQVKHKIAGFWVLFEQIKQAQNQAKVIVNEIKNGNLFSAVAGKHNLPLIAGRITRMGVTAPSVLKLSENAVGLFYKARKNEPVSFVNEQGTKGIKIVIGVVRAIERSKEKIETDDTKDIALSLKQAYVNDIINEYLMLLRNKYPVEINAQYFKTIGKSELPV